MSSKESSPGSVPEKTDCLVCGSGRSFPKNPILFCDGPGCDIPVHQKCYGVDVVPSGNWYCQRCEDRIPVLNTPCCCCPQTSGAFKRTIIPNQYIHPACARFHPSLDATVDPIEFDASLVNKQICCLCKSDTGICSPCSADSCSRAMHVTCAQEQDLMTKGKHAQIYCDVHRDTGVLSRIMKSQSAQRRASASSSAAGGGTGRSKRAKYYGESSEDDEDDDDEDEEDDDEDVVMEEESEDDILKSRSSTHSSVSSSRGSKGHTKNKRSLDSNGRRRRNISSGSEEIDVDDTEAVLGSSLGGSTTQKKVSKSAKTNTKETAAESQRRRLLQALDKNKKKQGTGAGVFANVSNLSTMPIRTLGGIGVTTGVLGSPSAAEPKQKLPGVNRNGNNPPAFDTTSYSPINNTLSNNVSGQNNGRNPKGLTFDLDPAIDASAFKTASPLLPSGAPSPVFPNYSNSGSPLHARGGHERQQSSSKTEELQAIVQSLQNKVATLENTIQGMTQQQQHLQQKLAASNNRTPPSGTPTTAHTPTSSTSATTSLIQANPHTVGQPGQDLQYKFDVLQHTHAQDKMRNLSLRENLRDIFGFLQVSVGLPVNENRRGSVGEANVEWSAERLDEYVQMLRDTLVGTDSASSSSSSSGARPALDVKRRDMIVDRVMKEISN